MSFWDRIKPTQRAPTATSVKLIADGRGLELQWEDGKTTELGARHLRQACPCAGCVDEWTRKRTLDPASVPETIRILEVHPVGNYALTFAFGDGHGTGIYNWTFLRELSATPPGPS